jgi:hypothetical protein
LLIDFGFGQGATKEHTRLLIDPPSFIVLQRIYLAAH